MTKSRWKLPVRCIAMVLILSFCVCQIPMGAVVLAAESETSQAPAQLEQDDPVIVAEDIAKREENTKHFRMSDGSYTAVSYDAPVHYRDAKGKWADINNELDLIEDAEGHKAYRSKNAVVSTAFSADLDSGELFTTSFDNVSVTMRLLACPDAKRAKTALSAQKAMTFNRKSQVRVLEDTASAFSLKADTAADDNVDAFKIDTIDSSVLYPDVYPDTDLCYTAYSYNIKEQIIVNKPRSSYCYMFLLELDGLHAVLNDDGSISLCDKKNAEKYYIPAPYMEDANGVLSYDVAYALEETAEGIILTVTADETWLNAKDRAFPVAIDPTLQVTTQKYETYNSSCAIYQSYVTQGTPTTSAGGYQHTYLGYGSSSSVKYRYAYLHFNKMPTIPSGSIVSSALFGMYMADYSSVGCSSMPLGAYEVTTSKPSSASSYYSWLNGLTWNTKPSFDTSNEIDYVVTSKSVDDQYQLWEITELVKKWYAEGTKNRTMAIAPSNRTGYSSTKCAVQMFHSYGLSTSPQLLINYRSCTGIESYYTYTNASMGAAGDAYIADATGQLKIVTPLLGYSSTVNPVSINLVYNSDYFLHKAADYSYKPPISLGLDVSVGHGWTLDVIQKMEDAADSDYKKYTDGDGTVHYFRKKSGDTTYFYDEDGLGLKVKKTGTKSYTMSDDHGNVYKFTNNFLTEKTDAEGNSILINYSGNRLVSVAQKNNGYGSIPVAEFTYSSTSNSITEITGVADNVIQFVYSSETGNLSVIKKNGINLIRYGYVAHRIRRAVDADSDCGVAFTYDSIGRVATYNEVDSYTSDENVGAKVSVTYPNSSKTTYRDFGQDREENTADDILNHFLFDYAGHTINAYTTDNVDNIIGASNAVYTGYSSTSKKNNRTTRAATVGRSAHQLLRNTGAENTETYLWTHTGTAVSTAKARTGLRSIKGTLNDGTVIASRVTETLQAGQEYTFSAYVNTAAVTAFDGIGVRLRVKNNIADVTCDSDPINYQTSTELEGGWVRTSLTFTAQTSDQHVVSVLCGSGSGVFYADDFQLEKGGEVSTYNMLENSSFEMSEMYGWTLGDKATRYTTLGAGGSAQSIKVTSTPTDTTGPRAHQDITVNLPSSETYVISGWAVGFAVPDNTNPNAVEDKSKQFGIRVALYYTDDTKDVYYTPFNADLTGWQFTSYTIVPKKANKTVERIRVICAYEGNANRAYFDNISLTREIAQTMKYDDDGNLKSVTSTGLSADVNTYEGGNLIQTVTGGYGTYTYRHTNKDRPHRITSVAGYYLAQTFGNRDSKGNVKGTELKNDSHPDSPTMVSFAEYSGSGNLQTAVTDVNGNTTTYEYGSTNNHVVYGIPQKITYANGMEQTQTVDHRGRTTENIIANSAKVEYTYGAMGLSGITRTDLTNEKQQSYGFTYDSYGNRTGASIGDRLLAAYTYGLRNGPLTEMRYGNGAYTQYTYDTLGRAKTTTYDGTRTLTYTYDGNGQLSRLEDSGVDGTPIHGEYRYDTLGRLIASRKQIGTVTTLQTAAYYNKYNQLTKQSWCVGRDCPAAYTERYEYDTHDGLIVKLVSAVGGDISIGRDTLRREATVTAGPYEKQYTYRLREDGHTTSQIATITYSGLADALAYGYTYDSMGNIVAITDPIDGEKTYTYDPQGQMTQETIGDKTYTYTYDGVGNILSATKDGVAHTYTYGDDDWGDLLTAYDGNAITYDAIGNPLTYYNGQSWNFTWVNGRTLQQATSGDTVVSYAYDKTDGMRLSKTVGDVVYEYFYADSRLMRMTISDGTVMDFFYDHNGLPYAVKYNGTNYYYILNQQGDVVRLVSAEGETVGTYQYDAWGNILSSTDNDLTNVNPLRYRGYVYDTETGLYYVSSRYYDPKIGRFINADGVIAGIGGDTSGYNMFAYCVNNPVNMFDPTGNWPKWIEKAANWVNKNIIQPVKNFFSPSTAVAATANNLPRTGEPGSSQTLPNPDGTPKQKRWYGPDGNAVRDRDYNHSGHGVPFPHDHEWKNGQRQKDHLPPSPDYEFSLDPVLGVGLVTICVVGFAVVAADDATGIGVADDFLFAPLGAGVGEGLILIFG